MLSAVRGQHAGAGVSEVAYGILRGVSAPRPSRRSSRAMEVQPFTARLRTRVGHPVAAKPVMLYYVLTT